MVCIFAVSFVSCCVQVPEIVAEMDLPQVDTCCFGLVPLRTGTMIVGIVTLIIELSTQGYGLYHSNDWTGVVYGILVVAGVVSSILLIIGVYGNNRLFVKIYLISFACLIIFAIVMMILILLQHRDGVMPVIFNTVIYVCVVGYCLIVANSYYKTMA